MGGPLTSRSKTESGRWGGNQQACCSVTQSGPTLWEPAHGLQRTRLHCPELSPGVCSNSCPFESVMPSNHLILCCRLLLLPSIFPSIRVFFRESALPIWWPKYWSFSFFSTCPSNGYSGLISWRKTECGSQQCYRESQRQTRLFKTWHMAYHFLDPGQEYLQYHAWSSHSQKKK